MKKILVASPVRQTPRILKHFLKSIAGLSRGDFDLDYAFVDDNTDSESSKILHQVQADLDGDVWIVPGNPSVAGYGREGATHQWEPSAIWKVAAFKDDLIERARNAGYDGLFLVDSDLVLPADTLTRLVCDNVDVVSMVFWTSWTPGQKPLPQVWVTDQYTMDEQFIAQLRKPGVYKVGGLGACTLISRRALENGVRFARIDNLTFAGEDRHFCIRARAMGIELYADTTLSPMHLYRDRDVDLLEGIDPATDMMCSRFVREIDARVTDVEFPLPLHWWSRPYEYAWAQNFVEPDHEVLEAACGISEPLKLWLAKNAKSVSAFDKDERILSKESIVGDIADDFGPEAARRVSIERVLDKIATSQAELVKLPYVDSQFDLVLCVSGFGRLPVKEVLGALSELRRVLKPDGLGVLTFESPQLRIEQFETMMQLVGLKFAGTIDREVPQDALSTHARGDVTYCFRAVVTPTPLSRVSAASPNATLAFVMPLSKWDPARVANQQRLKQQLTPFPDWVNPKIVATNFQRSHMSEWFRLAVDWMIAQTDTHGMLLQDDTRLAPDFWTHLQRILMAKPDHVIAFHTVSPDARHMQAARLKWYTIMDVIPGVAWVFPMHLLRKMRRWEETSLRPGYEERLTEDMRLGLFCAVHNIPIWHPMPTIVDHRVSDKEIQSTYGHDNLANRNAVLTWENAALPEDWTGKAIWCGRGFDDTTSNLARNVREWSDQLMTQIEKGSPPAERGAPDPEILSVMVEEPTTSSRS